MKSLLCLLLTASAKDHFIVNEGKAIDYNEHAIVQSGKSIEKCFFKSAAIDSSNTLDQFCLTYSASSSTGFAWSQDIQDYSKTSK